MKDKEYVRLSYGESIRNNINQINHGIDVLQNNNLTFNSHLSRKNELFGISSKISTDLLKDIDNLRLFLEYNNDKPSTKPKPKPTTKQKAKPKPKPKPKQKSKVKPKATTKQKANAKPNASVSKNISNIHNLRAQIDNFYKN